METQKNQAFVQGRKAGRLMEENGKKQRKITTVIEISKQVIETTTTPQMQEQKEERWQWVEASIWTNSMLTALASGVKGRKWFSLIDKVYKAETLKLAWEKVKRNKGAAGIDKITVQKYAAKYPIYLAKLITEIKEDRYQPRGVKRTYIPKEKGKMRALGLPTMNDKVVQQAVKMVIEPIFENEFLDISYGFRSQRGAKQALSAVSGLIEEGYTWVVDADLQSYFDTIPHDRLMTKIKDRISDGKILNLIQKWLKQDIIEECNNWKPTEGTPQGGVISPLLSNIYLHDLDVLIIKAGYKMIRYADDFVILTKTENEAKEALILVQKWVSENMLILHPEKTHIGNCMEKGNGFDFLGYRFETGTKWIRNKSIMKFRDRVRQVTSRVCGKALKEVVKILNPILRGWSAYFVDVSRYSLGTFDGFVRRRLRAIIAKQNKRSGFGAGSNNIKIPNSFFANLGLFNMEDYQTLYRARRSQ
jgi:RNA-directed DNA polymerase